MSQIRILLADDHIVMRRGLRLLLESQPGFSVVAEASDGRQAVERAEATHPDVAVLDIAIGPDSGLDLLPELRRHNGAEIPVIVFSVHGADMKHDPRVQANFGKSQAALDHLVASVHDRQMLALSHTRKEII